MIRRILALALVAVFAGVLVAGCSETEQQTIENTVRDYYSAYNDGAWDGCLGHIYDANNLGAGAIRSALEESKAATGDVTVDSVENVIIAGSSATADIKTNSTGGPKTQRWTFVKTDSGWTIRFPFG